MHTAYSGRDLVLHPLFSLFTRPLATGLTSIGLTPVEASSFVVAVSAGTVAALLFFIARGLHLTVRSSLLTCAMFVVSGAFSFWWSVVEAFPIGGATISFLFLIIVTGERSRGIWVVATILTFSMTVTNGFVSVVGAHLRFGIWKAQKIALASLVMVMLLLVIQQAKYPVSIGRTVETLVQDASSDDTPSPYLPPVVGRLRRYGEMAVDTYLKERRFVYFPRLAGEGIREATLTILRGYAERTVSFVAYPGVVPKPVLIPAGVSPAPRIKLDHLAYRPSGVLAVGC